MTVTAHSIMNSASKIPARIRTLPALPIKKPHLHEMSFILRQAARRAIIVVQRVYPAVLVVGAFGLMVAATIALKLAAWLSRFPLHR